tara:strand:- start:475 stop:612 length:138 start_codon:yes stop_codon:yes gene_type:complete
MDDEKVCTTCGAEFVMFGDYNLCGYDDNAFLDYSDDNPFLESNLN